jgi:hypothetical protein
MVSFPNPVQGAKPIRGDGSGQTVAIVDAFDNPNLASDLANFDATFHLPAANVTKVDQTGAPVVHQVRTAYTWGLETALDVEWVHALAPGARILLVEAFDPSYANLLTAVNYAKGVSGVISNSYGSAEFPSETYYDSTFTTSDNHATFVFASGDRGAPGLYPAASPNVLAVGGTSLTVNTTPGGKQIYGSESGWAGSGGGLSAFESGRRSPDVAFLADPNTGVFVLDTFYPGGGGWFGVGGTSLAAPMWSALLGISNQGRALRGLGTLGNAQQAVYSLPSVDFHDIVTGNNGYAAGPGYDFVTGLGTPIVTMVARDLSTFHTGPLSTAVPGATGDQGFAGPKGFAQPGESHSVVMTFDGSAMDASHRAPVAAPVPPAGAKGDGSGPIAAASNMSSSSPGLRLAVVSSSPIGSSGLGAPGNDEMFLAPTGVFSAAPDLPPVAASVLPAAVAPAAVELEASDAVFADGVGAPVESGSALAPVVTSAEPLDPAAMAGFAVLIGGYWGSQPAEAESRKRPTIGVESA